MQKSGGKEKKAPLQNKPPRNHIETEQRVIKMFGKYITSLENVALSDKAVKNEIPLMEILKKYMIAIFFLYRTYSYRYTIKTEGSEECTLIELRRSRNNPNTATEYLYRLTSLFALYLMKSTLQAENNSFIKKKTDSYKQYAFELSLAVFSVCDWINEGNEDYQDWASKYKAVSLMDLKKALKAEVNDKTPANVFRRLDRATQELNGFDKAVMQRYILYNVSTLVNNNIKYPEGNLLWSDKFGYVYLKQIQPNMAIPLTMTWRYNRLRNEHCPDYLFLYNIQRLLPVKPKT